MRMFKHPLFWVLCVIAGMLIVAGVVREPSRHHKAQYAGEPRKHDEKAAQPKCASPASEQKKASRDWVRDRLADLLKQTM
jgi:hypothetical protein